LLSEQQQHHQSLLASQQSRAKVRNQLQQSVQNDELKLTKLVKAEKALKARLEELRRQREEQERRERAERERLAKLKAEQERQRRLEAQRLAAEQKRIAEQQRIAAQQQKVGEQQRLAAEQQRVAEQQDRVADQQAAARSSSAKASSGGYGGLKTNGSLRWPVQGPILISYGSPRTAQLKWKGTLIGASEGTQVKAVAPGQIVYADWLDGFGMLLVIDHGRGYMSLYGHNQSLLRQVGQNVEQGEPVALVGDSGGQDRPGLYFEIRYQGEAINPTKWLAKG